MVNSVAKRNIMITLCLHFVYAWVSINIYLPALPMLAEYFNTSAVNIKLSITYFTLAFAISQLIWGPLSEKYGKKNIMILSTALSILGVIIVVFSRNFVIFNLGRFIEALGVGSISVLGRSILHEFLDEKSYSRSIAIVSSAVSVMPAIAPIIGGYLLVYIGWRSIFIFLLIFNIYIWYLQFRHIEKCHERIFKKFTMKYIIVSYISNFKNPKFLAALVPYLFALGAMFAYYAAAPYIYVTTLGYTPDNYSYFSLITVGAYVVGATVTSYITKHLAIKKVLGLGVCILLISTTFFIVALFYSTSFMLWSLLVPMSIHAFACGLISPSTNTEAMNVGKDKRGFTAASLTFSIYLCASIQATLLTNLPLKTNIFFNLYFIVASLLAFVSIFVLPLKPFKNKT